MFLDAFSFYSTAFPEPSDFVDPLADGNGCARDLPYLQQLGINTIRVYSVNSSLNHDACMSALSGAGIYTMYVLATAHYVHQNGYVDSTGGMLMLVTFFSYAASSIDLSLPLNGSIDRASPQWGTNLLDLYITTIEVFSKYDNVLGYNVGNEVANSINTTIVAPFVKAAARDVKGTHFCYSC